MIRINKFLTKRLKKFWLIQPIFPPNIIPIQKNDLDPLIAQIRFVSISYERSPREGKVVNAASGQDKKAERDTRWI